MKYIKNFSQLRLTDIPSVGGKNASLGQMIADLQEHAIRVPHGFAINVDAYWYFMKYNTLTEQVQDLLHTLTNNQDLAQLKKVGAAIRVQIAQGQIPDDLVEEISTAYHALSKQYGRESCDVAVRSSATAEDLLGASFAGQQDTFLNVRGVKQLLQKYKEGIASLFTDRAIVYRQEKGFDHFKVGISIGVQKMVRADKACSGVSFSIDTETGFKDVIVINAIYGLGELLVKGEVVPDEYIVHKSLLQQGYTPIIKKQLGSKQKKLVYDSHHAQRTMTESVAVDMQRQWCLTDEEILELAHMALTIEECYTRLQKRWSPMDIEWAKDSFDGLLYCVQARPETVHAVREKTVVRSYSIKSTTSVQLQKNTVLTGQSIGNKIVHGCVRVVTSMNKSDQLQKGDILVTSMTDPDWVPVMKQVAGIITDSGGRTCHAAIVARELGIPAIVGTSDATKTLKNGQEITLDCSRGSTGYVYQGSYAIEEHTTELAAIKKLPVKIMVNIGDPETAFAAGLLPVDGVGLARMEFIISNLIKVHPMAFANPAKITNEKIRRHIAQLTQAYLSGTEFFIHTLASGIGMIAAGFFPRPVIVRFSDFKTNEYRNLIGGSYFEPIEENPMLGLRGASRYYNPLYSDAFSLECAAVARAREVFGLKNIALMIPFVRTVKEACTVVSELQRHGLERGKDGLQLFMMVEIPSNVFLLEQFSEFFDGFSIGSNDLTQLTLGVDRDAQLLSSLFDERDPAVQEAMKIAIQKAKAAKKTIGICGQAPSDYPEFGKQLMDYGIDSISLNVDSVLPFLMRYGSTDQD